MDGWIDRQKERQKDTCIRTYAHTSLCTYTHICTWVLTCRHTGMQKIERFLSRASIVMWFLLGVSSSCVFKNTIRREYLWTCFSWWWHVNPAWDFASLLRPRRCDTSKDTGKLLGVANSRGVFPASPSQVKEYQRWCEKRRSTNRRSNRNKRFKRSASSASQRVEEAHNCAKFQIQSTNTNRIVRLRL